MTGNRHWYIFDETSHEEAGCYVGLMVVFCAKCNFLHPPLPQFTKSWLGRQRLCHYEPAPQVPPPPPPMLPFPGPGVLNSQNLVAQKRHTYAYIQRLFTSVLLPSSPLFVISLFVCRRVRLLRRWNTWTCSRLPTWACCSSCTSAGRSYPTSSFRR